MKQFLNRLENGYSNCVEAVLRFLDDEVPAWLALPLIPVTVLAAGTVASVYLAARWVLVPKKYWP